MTVEQSVCPRHPERESYVRCQRCERPACPQCQRPAAVGFHCVDCVREASHDREARTLFGGRVAGGRPLLTQAVVVVSAVVFLLQLVPGIGEVLLAVGAFWPHQALSQPWRFLTAGFLHSPGFVLHVVFNLMALWLIGQYLEPLLGRLRFGVMYLLSILGGSAAVYVLADPSGPEWFAGTIGASGGVFGLAGGLLVVERQRRRDIGPILVLLGLNLGLGFLVAGISWQAHVGGLLTGAGVAVAMVHAPPGRRALWQALGTGAVALLVLLVVTAKSAVIAF